MTHSEYRVTLDTLSDEDYVAFEKELGGDSTTRDRRVREFIANNAKLEGEICRLLGLKTESEKSIEAAQVSAKADRDTSLATRAANLHMAEANQLAAAALKSADHANDIAARALAQASHGKWIAVAALVTALFAALAQFGSWLRPTSSG